MDYISDRSKLYKLEPVGLSTGLVESIISYLLRIAYEHNLDIGKLVNKIIIQELDKHYLKNSTHFGGNSFFEGAKTLNGFDSNAQQMVVLLEMLTTRNDLNRLTIIRFRKVFSNRSLFKENLSWCPKCLREWKQYDTLYYPLLWYFKLVKVCHEHKTVLMGECEECSKTNDIIRRKMIVGYCSYCHNPLDSNGQVVSDLSASNMNWYEFCYLNIEKILSFNFEQTENKFVKVDVVNQLNKILTEYFFFDLNSFSKQTSIPKSTLWGWIKGVNLPTLEGLLKICYAIDIDLVELLNSKVFIKEKITTIKQKQVHKVPSKRVPLNFNEIEMALDELLILDTPISMTQAATKIGRDKRVLYKNFPIQCKKISQRYSNHIKKNSRERIERLKVEINLEFESLLLQDVYPSRTSIEKGMGRPGLLRERALREFWELLIVKLEKNRGGNHL